MMLLPASYWKRSSKNSTCRYALGLAVAVPALSGVVMSAIMPASVCRELWIAVVPFFTVVLTSVLDSNITEKEKLSLFNL